MIDPAAYVVTLTDPDDRELLGIWGPYPSTACSEAAKQELASWPIEGEWSVVALKHYPVAPAPTKTPGPTQAAPATVWWSSADGNVQHD